MLGTNCFFYLALVITKLVIASCKNEAKFRRICCAKPNQNRFFSSNRMGLVNRGSYSPYKTVWWTLITSCNKELIDSLTK